MNNYNIPSCTCSSGRAASTPQLPTPNSYQGIQNCRVITVTGAWGQAGDQITEVKWFQTLGSLTPVYRGTVYFNERTRAQVTGVDGTNSSQCDAAIDDEQTLEAEDALYLYVASAPPGTALTDSKWKVYRIEKTNQDNKQYANASATYTNTANALLTLNFGYTA